MYPLDAEVMGQEVAAVAKDGTRTWDEWHAAFGHAGMTTMKKLHNVHPSKDHAQTIPEGGNNGGEETWGVDAQRRLGTG